MPLILFAHKPPPTITSEILRDYGFLEDYPQIWCFSNYMWQVELHQVGDGGLRVRWKQNMRPVDDELKAAIVYFRKQIRRLQQTKNMNYPHKDKNRVPDDEWDIAWSFYDAYIVAMTTVLQDVKELAANYEGTKELPCTPLQQEGCTEWGDKIFPDQVQTVRSHYDALEREFDDLDYINPSCDNKEIMLFEGSEELELLDTHYQTLNFAIDRDSNDICMDLDNIVQICDCYRPQYHEYVVHAAARFLDDVQRVIFIGGGDSMLLHEALKYPNLKKVVGLELDQVVVRKSFIHFQTQPHFDDDRVEWWFGDATKSLLLLPEEYWGSFDLVLVDLSETAMSLSVTKELDVFGALALLLHDDGVMVKNELYVDHFSDVFDYTVEIYYDSPIICSQVVAMGSNKHDFFHSPAKDHGVETLLYEPMVNETTHLDLVHHYHYNDPVEQGKCGPLRQPDEEAEQGRSAGVMEIVDLEQVRVTLDQKLFDKLAKVVKKEGFELATVPSFTPSMGLIKMKEGYILARLYPDQKYCALDINLWGHFHKLQALSKALADTIKAQRVSSYRVVVGGMYGSSTWKEDRKIVGPKIVQKRNCDRLAKKNEEVQVNGSIIENTTVVEGINLLPYDDSIAIVLCDTAESCVAADLAKQHPKVSDVLIMTCPPMNVPGDTSKTAENMFACERSMFVRLHGELGSDRVDLLLVDGRVSKEFLQVWDSIFSSRRLFMETFEKNAVAVLMDPHPSTEEWRQHFLDRFRKDAHHDPIGHAKIRIQAGLDTYVLGAVVCQQERVAYIIESLEQSIVRRFEEQNISGIEVETVYIRGGLYPWMPDFEPNNFKATDYDMAPALKQYVLDTALNKALQAIDVDVTLHDEISEVGDGTVFVHVGSDASAVSVWDGRSHVDVNFFNSLDAEKPDLDDKFLKVLLQELGGRFKVALRDDMPRGTGRVVNFAEDMRWTGYTVKGPKFKFETVEDVEDEAGAEL